MTRTKDSTTEPVDWLLCARCTVPVYTRKWERNLRVCQECGYHGPLTAAQRLEALLDQGSVETLALPAQTEDLLGFVDTRPYPARLAEARERTGMHEAVLCARGTIRGNPVIVAAMDFRFLGGSLGGAVGELVTQAAETALAQRVPLLVVAASGGARMQEGAVSLMQMAKTSAAMARLDEAGVLSVCLVTDPTFGGVAASFATLADVIVAEPGARLGFAGRRVIEQTIRQKLPPDFQTAEFLLERGFVDMIVPRHELRRELAKLLRVGGYRTPEPLEDTLTDREDDPLVRDPGLLPHRDPWELVRQARSLDRPTTLEYLSLAFADFQELHGDRVSGDCPAIVAGTAWLAGRPVVAIGHQKGHTPAELAQRNFGMAVPAGYRKAVRLMRLAAKLRLPVVTLVDTPGAYPGAEAEERGQAVAIAESIRYMSGLPVPVVAVLTGEGGSGGALALATANRVLALANTSYSVISPEGCAAILWQDPAAAPQAAHALGLDPRSLLSHGIVDGVLPEPAGGTGSDHLLAADRLRWALIGTLAELDCLGEAKLVDDRRERFRAFGGRPSVEAEVAAMHEVVR